MKRKLLVPFAAVAMFGLMASFATVAQAFPTKTTACTSCHGGANVPVTATAGAGSAASVTYALAAPGSDSIAVFDGATKVAALTSPSSFTATVGKTYTAYSVAGPGTGDGVGSITFTVKAPVVTPPVVTPPVVTPPVVTPPVVTPPVVTPPVVTPPVVTPPVVTPPVVTPPVVTPPVVTPDPGTDQGSGYTFKKHLRIKKHYAKRLTATLTDSATGAVFTTKVDRKGNVKFTNIPAGTYTLTVTGRDKSKFRPMTVVVGASDVSDQNRDSHEDGDDD